MNTLRSLLGLLLSGAIVACGGGGSGISSALNKQGEGPINGTWNQTTMNCDGTAMNTMDSVTLTITGAHASLLTSFDNGSGGICAVRTSATVVYSSNLATFTFGESTCSSECLPFTCASRGGKTLIDFTYILAEPNLKLTTDNDSLFGCNNSRTLEINFVRQ